MRELKLTAHIANQYLHYSKIQVFQNGGLAGVLTVDTEQAERIVNAITAAPTLLKQRDVMLVLLLDTASAIERNNCPETAVELRSRIAAIAEAEKANA